MLHYFRVEDKCFPFADTFDRIVRKKRKNDNNLRKFCVFSQ